MAAWRQSCCNPFNKVRHTVREKSQLRAVTKMCKKVPSILQGEKIWHTCRKQVSDMSEHAEPDQYNSRPFTDEQSSPYDHDYPKIELSHNLLWQTHPLNQSLLHSSGTIPLLPQNHEQWSKNTWELLRNSRKLHSKKYEKSKLQTVLKMMEMVGNEMKMMRQFQS